MAVNLNALKTEHGVLKIIEWALVLTTLLIARLGLENANATFGGGIDGVWLGYVTVGGFNIIMPITVLGVVLGDQVPWRMEVLFGLMGGILFCTVGGLTIHAHHGEGGSDRNCGLALGSLALASGIVLLADATVIGKKYKKYLNV